MTKKNLKPRRDPVAALAVAAAAAPLQPPASMPAPVPQQQLQAAPEGALADKPTTLNLRVRTATLDALVAAAKDRGMTLKQVVAHALVAAGVAVAPADLEDRTPRRKP